MKNNNENNLILSIKISPNAKKNEIIKTDNDIKIKITAQPIDGKANKALVEFISKTFKIPKTSISIVKGETSKEKTISIISNDNEKLAKIKSMLQI